MENSDPEYTIFEIEDKMHAMSPPIFFNGLNNRPASMMAYMTCLDFIALETFLKKEFDLYPREIWERCCQFWEGHGYLSPTSSILASYITRSRLS